MYTGMHYVKYIICGRGFTSVNATYNFLSSVSFQEESHPLRGSSASYICNEYSLKRLFDAKKTNDT